MGLSLELTFLSLEMIDRQMLRAELAEFGLDPEEIGGSLDLMTWNSKGRQIRVDATAYHGEWNAYFVRIGFDSNLLRDLSFDERKELIDDFLALGLRVWNAFHFYEGELSPEDGGPLLYGLRDEGTLHLIDMLPQNNYARFLSSNAASLSRLHGRRIKGHPFASIRSLPNGGVLVIWDDSRAGLERFLSDKLV